MSSLPPPTSAPAGWYPDPEGRPALRYFDGHAWHDPVGPALAPARAPHETLPVAAAVGALVILLASLVGGRLLIELLVTFRWPVLAYAAILAVVGYGPSVVWCWYVSRRWGTGRLGADIGLRFRWSDLGWGPLIWISAVICQVVVAAVVLATGIPTSSNVEGIGEIDADRSYVVALLITAVVAAPIVEEMVFRGVVMRGLLARLGVVITIALQAVLFGLAHVDPVRGVGNVGLVLILSGVGAALGVAAFLLRRIGPVIIAHAIFNGVVLAIVLSGLADRLQERIGDRVGDRISATEQIVGIGVAEGVEGVGADERGVVDQADPAHPCSDHEQRPVDDRVEGGEGGRIDHLRVLEADLGVVATGSGLEVVGHQRFHGPR